MKWRPIESAPTDGRAVLVAEGAAAGEAKFHEGHGWWWAGNDPTDAWGRQVYPTHWMPLPEPPMQQLGKSGGMA